MPTPSIYKIHFTHNLRKDDYIRLFFIALFLLLLIASTHLLTSFIAAILCLANYLYFHRCLVDYWPEHGTLLFVDSEQLHLELGAEPDVLMKQYTILPASIHTEHFVVLKLKQMVNGKTAWLVLLPVAMSIADYCFIRRAVVAIKTQSIKAE